VDDDAMSEILSLVVVGGGEHARVLLDAARTRPDAWSILGYLDVAAVPETDARCSVRWLGTDDDAPSLIAPDVRFCLGIGPTGPEDRRSNAVERLSEVGADWASVVHAGSQVSPSVRIGQGVAVFAGAIVNSGARLDDHCVINSGAIVEHDASVGAFTHVGPGAAIGGGVVIGDHCVLGLGCRIRDHIEIGHRAQVAMGAVVVDHVSTGSLVVGVPARPRSPHG
jgi:acetyltransferase EpsM